MFFLYEFDIAAIILSLILICFYFQKHQISTLQNRSFLVYLCALTVVSFLEILISSIYTNNIPCPNIIRWGLLIIFLVITKVFGLIFAAYCIGLSGILLDKSKKIHKIQNIILVTPYFLALVVIFLSPLFCYTYPLAIKINADGYPVMNLGSFWYNFLFIIDGVYVLFSVVFFIVKRKKLAYTKRRVLYVCAVLAFIAVVVQLIIPVFAIEFFALALAGLIFFFYMQNPEELIEGTTRTFNQLAFIRISDQLFSRQVPFTCVSVLIDDTVFLSHTFGIIQLNNFLMEVAKFLRDTFGYENSFCINPNCFVILIKNPTEEKTRKVVNRLQDRFQMNWYYDAVELKLYIRECVVECPRCAKKSEEILDIFNLVASDERYKQPIVYASEIDLEYKRRNDYIEYALKNGIAQNRFDVYYQPIYSTADRRIIGAEALIRLRDEKGRFLSPEDFIPIAEKSGAILRIGEYVYESVCRTISQIDLDEYGIKKIDINLSVAQCMQEILAEQILSIQSIYQIPASIINLEITETAAAHSPEILLHNMERLAAAGFELSLDDYGSGYSNMNYMLNLPFKMIKIDKYIIWSAFSDERAKKALTATIQMIKSLGMTVLAEGVEDRSQAVMLAELGCDYLQGYFFSRPIRKNEFLALMKQQLVNPTVID